MLSFRSVSLLITLFVTALVPAATVRQEAPAAFELEEADIRRLQDWMAVGRHTSTSLTKLYLDRIRALDQAGPTVNSIIELNPDAAAIAAERDRERSAGRLRGPLHGVPIVIKDNIDTADRMMTTAGSLALAGAPASRDAFIVARLREAGAVILGKANLSEWANFRSTKSTSGWSARGGQTRNPYALDRNPCGSSSGSGAAVAANFAAAGIGTETDGSIVCPAAATGIVGLKPTVGLVSRSGIVPIAHSQDTAGPMTRTVSDAAILLGAIAGADPADAATNAATGHLQADYTRFLDASGLRGARIGVARAKVTGYSPPADRLFEQAIAALKQAGAELVDPADMASLRDYDDDEFEVLLYEFKADLNRYLATRSGVPIRSLKDAIAFNEQHHDRELRFFGQEIFSRAEGKGPLSDEPYRKALARSQKLARDGIDGVMRRHRLDAIVAPTGGPPWPIDLVNGDHFTGSSSTPAAVAGYPTITVPMGDAFGLPVGLTFIGGAWSESTLIRLAYAFEQATRHRKPPRLLPTASLGPG